MNTHVNAGLRLDGLPISKFHRRLVLLVGLGMFFDSFDNTLSSAVLASMLPIHFSTLQLNSLFLSATFIGLSVGAAFAGWLSDRIGRGFAFQFSLGIFGVLALASAFVPSMPVLIGVRALMAVGLGAEYVICYGMITEFIPRSHRGRYLGYLGIFAGLGVSLSSLLGWLVIPALSWRAMFVIGGVGSLIAWWMRRKMPESPRWLESRGRFKQAEAILESIERECGVWGQNPSVAPAAEQAVAQVADEKAKWVPVTVLFSRRVIVRTLMAVILTVIAENGSYALTGWMPTFFVKQGMTVSSSLGFTAAIMAGWVAGPLVCVFITDRLGRRKVLTIFGILTAVCAAIYPFMREPGLVIAVGFVLVSSVASYLIIALGEAPEYFPTAFRFRGGGVSQTAARISLIFSPFVVLWLFTSFGIAGVILAISGMYILMTVLSAFVRVDTSREALAELAPAGDESDGDESDFSAPRPSVSGTQG